MLKRFWKWFWSPSSVNMGALLVLGGVGGVLFWGGFNMFVDYSNTEAFCLSCHEMTHVEQDYRNSIHSANNAGVAAICSDCHVPKSWGAKMVRKIKATSELYHALVGTIDTPEKFENHRLDLARRVWRNMESNDSQECRNCHAFNTMTIATQREKSQKAHNRAIKNKETCIGCHKAISHRVPDKDIERALKKVYNKVEAAAAKPLSAGGAAHATATKKLYSEASDMSMAVAAILPGAPVKVMERRDNWLLVTVRGWRHGDNPNLLLSAPGSPIIQASLGNAVIDMARVEKEEGEYQQVSYDAWTPSDSLTENTTELWAYAAEINDLVCGRCHTPYPPGRHDAKTWIVQMKEMNPYARLSSEDSRILLAYLQRHAASGSP